jgi:peptide/nickel transport system permease protein
LATQSVRRRSASQLAVALRRFRRSKAGLTGLGMLVFMSIVAALGPRIAPYNVNSNNLLLEGKTDIAPTWLKPPLFHNWNFPFGTTVGGLDVFSGVLVSLHVDMIIGVGAALFAMALAILVGLVSGFYGRVVDTVLMRVTELFIVFPALLFLLLLSRLLAGRLTGVETILFYIIIIGVFSWAVNARLIRGEVLRVKSLEFIESEKALGASTSRIVFRHILPNVLAQVVVLTSFTVATSILTEVALFFLGFGSGNILSLDEIMYLNFPYMDVEWWAELFPGLSVVILVLAFNLLGDGLSDALNPKLRE